MVKVKFKRSNTMTPVPKKATGGSVAVDLVAVSAEVNYAKGYIEYRTGLHIDLPDGYGAFIYPRSSISNTPHSLSNSVGVIDTDYTGEIRARMRFSEFNSVDGEDVYKIGDRIAQMIVMKVPDVEYVEVSEITKETSRGAGGFGSTGK